MASQLSFEDVKNMEQSRKDIVFGYVKRVQKLLPDDNAYYIIPSLVCYWILLYFAPTDYFEPDLCNKEFILTDNNTVAAQRGGHEQVALLHNVATSGIHKWTFKLVKFDRNGYITLFGVFKARYSAVLTSQFFSSCYDNKVYVYDVWSGTKKDGDEYGIRCEEEDIIEMTLDLNRYELSYKVNDTDYGVAYKDIEQTSYRAGISGYKSYPTYQLLSYRVMACK